MGHRASEGIAEREKIFLALQGIDPRSSSLKPVTISTDAYFRRRKCWISWRVRRLALTFEYQITLFANSIFRVIGYGG
jgi:hypothetical protein